MTGRVVISVAIVLVLLAERGHAPAAGLGPAPIARRTGQHRRSGSWRRSSSGACSRPTPRTTSLGIEARVTFEDGTHGGVAPPRGPADRRQPPLLPLAQVARARAVRRLPDPVGAHGPVDRQRVRRPTVAGRQGAARAPVPRELARGRASRRTRSSSTTRTCPTPTRRTREPPRRSTSPWDRFFFEPQSTAPMTLVRVAWGAVTARLGAQPPPGHRPVLHGGRAPLRTGPARRVLEPAPPPRLGSAGLADVRRAARRVAWRTMVGLTDPAQRRRRRAVPRGAAARQQRDLQLRRPAPAAGRDRRRAVAVRPAVVRGRAPSTVAGAASATLLRAPFGMRLLQLELAVGYLLSAWTKRGGHLARRHRDRAGRCASRTCSASWPPTGCSTRSVAAQPAHLVDPRLRGHVHRAGVEPPPAPVGLGVGVLPPPRHRRLPRHRLLQPGRSTSPTWPSSPPTLADSGSLRRFDGSPRARPLQASDPRRLSAVEPAEEHGHGPGIVAERGGRPRS